MVMRVGDRVEASHLTGEASDGHHRKFRLEVDPALQNGLAAAEREGVAPVYLLNGNNLEVVLSRQTVVRDHALKELIRVARARFTPQS